MAEQEIPMGAKVRIQGFPRPTDPNNHLNFNGLIGKVIKIHKIPFGSGNIAGVSHEYVVEFENVNVRKAVLDPKTRKLKRSTERMNAVQTFDESYVEIVEYPNTQDISSDPTATPGRSMPLPPKPTESDLPPLPDNMPVPENVKKAEEQKTPEQPESQPESQPEAQVEEDFPEVETEFFFTDKPEEK